MEVVFVPALYCAMSRTVPRLSTKYQLTAPDFRRESLILVRSVEEAICHGAAGVERQDNIVSAIREPLGGWVYVPATGGIELLADQTIEDIVHVMHVLRQGHCPTCSSGRREPVVVVPGVGRIRSAGDGCLGGSGCLHCHRCSCTCRRTRAGYSCRSYTRCSFGCHLSHTNTPRSSGNCALRR